MDIVPNYEVEMTRGVIKRWRYGSVVWTSDLTACSVIMVISRDKVAMVHATPEQMEERIDQRLANFGVRLTNQQLGGNQAVGVALLDSELGRAYGTRSPGWVQAFFDEQVGQSNTMRYVSNDRDNSWYTVELDRRQQDWPPILRILRGFGNAGTNTAQVVWQGNAF